MLKKQLKLISMWYQQATDDGIFIPYLEVLNEIILPTQSIKICNIIVRFSVTPAVLEFQPQSLLFFPLQAKYRSCVPSSSGT